MQDFLTQFGEEYAEKFGYTPEITDTSVVIQTPYGTLGFTLIEDEELKFLKIEPIDDSDDDQISSLIKIKKHFTGALKHAVEEHNAEDGEETEEPAQTPKPPKPKGAVAAKPEVDSLGRTCPEPPNKPPAHFTKPEKGKGSKKTELVEKTLAEPDDVLKPIPGTAAYGIAQRAKEAAAKAGVAVPGEQVTPAAKNALGNSKKAMDVAAKATVGPSKLPVKADPPDEPVEAEPVAEEEEEPPAVASKPTLDDVLDGKVTPPKKEPAAKPPVQRVPASTELVMEDAVRGMAYIKMLISSPSGGGKTLGALLVARGLCDAWNQICIIDTENKSGALYVGTEVDGVKIGTYQTITLTAPYTVDRYVRAMEMAEKGGIKVIIIDSLSHAWTADGGLLDLHTKITAASRSGNSYTAWKDVTPLHSKLIEKIQTCSMHVIITARSKMEHTLEKTDKGTAPKKVGMGIIFRDGLEYEVSTAFEIDQASHVAQVTKDRTMVFSETPYLTLGVDAGKQIRAWLEQSAEE